jgi:hypothetical protein
MPAVAIVADVLIANTVGATLATAVGEVVGSALIGDIVSGAVIGAIGGGLGAAVQGGDVWKGAEQGAISGGVSGGVSGALQGAELTGTSQSGGSLDLTKAGLSSNAAKALASGLGRTAGAVATGTPFTTALEEGAITGVVDYAIPSKGKGDYTSALERSLVGSGLQAVLGVGAPRNVRGGGSPFITGSASKQAGSTPGSAALGQALNVGDAGSPIFGSKGDEKSKKNVWNVQSLRYMGQPEESSSG